MKRKRVVMGVLLAFAISVGSGLFALESQESLGWRRVKRHARLAIKWKSPSQLQLAFTPPPSRRIAAIMPDKRAPNLFLAPLGDKSGMVYPASVIRYLGPSHSDLEIPGGDVEWDVMAPAGRYTLIFTDTLALRKCVVVDWDPSKDLDLGRIEMVYGDWDGDNEITRADYRLARINSGSTGIDLSGRREFRRREREAIPRHYGKKGDPTPLVERKLRVAPSALGTPGAKPRSSSRESAQSRLP